MHDEVITDLAKCLHLAQYVGGDPLKAEIDEKQARSFCRALSRSLVRKLIENLTFVMGGPARGWLDFCTSQVLSTWLHPKF